MNRPVVIAAVVAVLVVAVVQRATLVIAPVSMAVAGVLAGGVLGMRQRPVEAREVLVPGAVVGLAGMLTSAVLMALRGTEVLQPRFLLSWVLVAMVGLVLSAGVALLLGKVMPDAHA